MEAKFNSKNQFENEFGSSLPWVLNLVLLVDILLGALGLEMGGSQVQ